MCMRRYVYLNLKDKRCVVGGVGVLDGNRMQNRSMISELRIPEVFFSFQTSLSLARPHTTFLPDAFSPNFVVWSRRVWLRFAKLEEESIPWQPFLQWLVLVAPHLAKHPATTFLDCRHSVWQTPWLHSYRFLSFFFLHLAPIVGLHYVRFSPRNCASAFWTMALFDIDGLVFAARASRSSVLWFTNVAAEAGGWFPLKAAAFSRAADATTFDVWAYRLVASSSSLNMMPTTFSYSLLR